MTKKVLADAMERKLREPNKSPHVIEGHPASHRLCQASIGEQRKKVDPTFCPDLATAVIDSDENTRFLSDSA